MEAVIISRRIVKLPYTAVRRPFAFLNDRVLRRTRAAAPARDEERAGPGAVPAQAATDATAEHAEPAMARTVDVTFTLPGEVGAGNVALCGDFNGWSPENIALQRGSDGAWQVTIALEPGTATGTGTCSTANAGKTPGTRSATSPTPSAAPTPSSPSSGRSCRPELV